MCGTFATCIYNLHYGGFMNQINTELERYKLSLYILGKHAFRYFKNQKDGKIAFRAFCNQRKKVSDSFRLKYLDGLTASKIADMKFFSDERSVYKQIDRDMVNFGAWLVSRSDEAESLETIRKRLETVISTECENRGITVTDKKAWNKLSSDILKALLI